MKRIVFCIALIVVGLLSPALVQAELSYTLTVSTGRPPWADKGPISKTAKLPIGTRLAGMIRIVDANNRKYGYLHVEAAGDGGGKMVIYDEALPKGAKIYVDATSPNTDQLYTWDVTGLGGALQLVYIGGENDVYELYDWSSGKEVKVPVQK